jgi:pSer/pThr/pTyr-binding forkhead associated (FHA) protein
VRTVRDEAHEYVTLGPEEYRARLGAPVLVELALRADEDEDFLTKPLTRPLMRETIEDQDAVSSMPRVSADAAVHFVRKRPHGAFPDRIGIGRAGTDIVLAYPLVSKYHAYFRFENGAWLLSDAGSRNGTFVGDARLGAGEAKALGDRVDVRLGPYGFRFYTPAAFAAYLAIR